MVPTIRYTGGRSIMDAARFSRPPNILGVWGAAEGATLALLAFAPGGPPLALSIAPPRKWSPIQIPRMPPGIPIMTPQRLRIAACVRLSHVFSLAPIVALSD